MRDYLITINDDGTVTQTPSTGYIDEHCATRLVITPSTELAAQEISYYTLCFNPEAGLENPMNIKVVSDILNLSEDGTIIYPLPCVLTSSEKLDVQVLAHIENENGILQSVVRSPIFSLNFSASVTGDEEIVSGGSGYISLIYDAVAQLCAAVDSADELCVELENARDSGEFNGATLVPSVSSEGILNWFISENPTNPEPVNIKGPQGEQGEKGDKGDKGETGSAGADATVNGYNAVTIDVGDSLTISQDGSAVTLDAPDIALNSAARHEHSNRDTLDKLYCASTEESIVADATDSDYLKYNNAPLRYCTDGAVISSAQEITKSGKKYMRLALNRDPVDISNVPDCVDIPVSAISTVEQTDNLGVTINAAELDLGISDAVENSHSHENKTVLDGISESVSGLTKLLKTGNKPICELPNYIYSASNHNDTIYAGINTFTNTAITELTITSFSNPFGFFNPEYVISFISGSTPTILAFPASVQWANELTVEANKKYQISIIDSIALWTAVEYGVSA